MATLPAIADLRVRFKGDSITGGADGDPVSSWPESSGLNHPAATQTTASKQPLLRTAALNTHRGVDFDGLDDVLAMSDTALDALRNVPGGTIVAVVIYQGPLSSAPTPQTVAGLSDGDSTAQARGKTFTVNGTPSWRSGGRRLDADSFDGVTGALVGTAATVQTTVFDHTGNGTATIYGDGSQTGQNTTFQGAGNTSDTRSLAGTIGHHGGDQFYNGIVVELLIYARALTASERSQVHSYVQDEYGITVSDYAGSTVVAAADLSGSGTLLAPGIPATSSAAALSGSGSLSAGTALAVAGSAALAGSGALAAGGAPAVAQSAALSGTGSLSGNGAPVIGQAAALSGTGALSAAGVADGATAASLSSAGTLSAAPTLAITTAAALSSAGTLAATAAAPAERIDHRAAHATLAAQPVGYAALTAAPLGVAVLAARAPALAAIDPD